jgi:hypothetical protein
MAHPFEKMFDRAIKESTPFSNEVLIQAEKLKEKGYSVAEIHGVLNKLHKSLIDASEAEIVGEAAEEFGRYLEGNDDEEDEV